MLFVEVGRIPFIWVWSFQAIIGIFAMGHTLADGVLGLITALEAANAIDISGMNIECNFVFPAFVTEFRAPFTVT